MKKRSDYGEVLAESHPVIDCGQDLAHLRILAEKAEDRIDRSRTAAETAERIARALPKRPRIGAVGTLDREGE